MSLDPATRFFLFHEMIRMGIIPYEDAKLDMTQALSQLSPDEAHASRRKFRKAWRKIARARKILHKKELGLENLNPGRGKKINRKYYVYYDILQKILNRKGEHSRKTS